MESGKEDVDNFELFTIRLCADTSKKGNKKLDSGLRLSQWLSSFFRISRSISRWFSEENSGSKLNSRSMFRVFIFISPFSYAALERGYGSPNSRNSCSLVDITLSIFLLPKPLKNIIATNARRTHLQLPEFRTATENMFARRETVGARCHLHVPLLEICLNLRQKVPKKSKIEHPIFPPFYPLDAKRQPLKKVPQIWTKRRKNRALLSTWKWTERNSGGLHLDQKLTLLIRCGHWHDFIDLESRDVRCTGCKDSIISFETDYFAQQATAQKTEE